MNEDRVLVDRVSDGLALRGVPFETVKMMGGVCFMVRGKMCVGVTKGRLMVRLDPAMEMEALEQPGCEPMDITGRPMKGFVFVHEEGHAGEDQLGRWLDLALEFNPRAKSSKKRS